MGLENSHLQEVAMLESFLAPFAYIAKPYVTLVREAKSLARQKKWQHLKVILNSYAKLNQKEESVKYELNRRMKGALVKAASQETYIAAGSAAIADDVFNDLMLEILIKSVVCRGDAASSSSAEDTEEAIHRAKRLQVTHELQKQTGFKSCVVDAEAPDSGVNPYSVEGFECMSCRAELSNMYMHCMGCEIHLSKDFNLCLDCFKNRKGDVLNSHKGCLRVSYQCHTGDNHTWYKGQQIKGKTCKSHQRSCKLCGFCSHCSCSCHSVYQMRCRFHPPQDMAKLHERALQQVVINQINYILPEYVVLRKLLEEAGSFDRKSSLRGRQI